MSESLPVGMLAEVVTETFHRAGITSIVPDTPAGLFVEVAKWDGLLNPVELRGLRMLVKNMTAMSLDIYDS